jgi:hypothetical protein
MIIILILGTALIWTFGYFLSCLLINKSSFWEKASLGFILGIGIFTFLWFLLNWAGIPYNLFSGMILILGLNLLALSVYRIAHKQWPWKTKININYFKNLSLLEKVGIGILIFLCVSAFIQNLYWPIRFWDSIALYDFRAKIFAETGFMQTAIAQGDFFGYPLLTSLAHALVYILGGGNPSFLYSLFYIFFLINFFINLKKMKLSRLAIIILTLITAVCPRLFEHTQWAYTNLPYTIYLVLSSIYLYFGTKNKDIGMFILSALLMGLSTWTRSTEPFWMSGVIASVLFSITIRKWLWPFVYTGLIASIMIPWRAFLAIHNEGSVNVVSQVTSVSSAVVQNLQASVLKPTIDFFTANVIQMYLIYFILFSLIILIKIFSKTKEWLFAFIVVLNIMLAFAGTLIFVKYIAYYQDIPDSLARMVMFISPLVVFLFAEQLAETKWGKSG